ncbi:hypothetical protein O159_19530 [Leifsonia xyli subsp. cynodontis DSM 46306]|uniref:Tape measure protein N-terminal domain-containing protein n=1 Tax=Leifsonia xyli subsp. cynodontis DSM 46306 TaxID=1389489 RepID=U3PEG4_LEIXC|nr:tape measure protein [Leifsonia xyli]AGW41968.1 hypothetical protein O159_19530 [Leifsonia xyli subsp. cynodontis DSM 46306]
MSEAAVAEVTIIPVSKGAQGQIEQQLGGDAVGAKVGARMGASLISSLGSILKGTGAAAVATAATGIGVALTSGFARLNDIEVAKAKLTGLGNSADTVNGIMANALAAVKGTAFGLGDAATVAAGAVAAGIKPGAQLEGVLKSVVNSAATAGTSLGDMGAIYNKVASTGKAQNNILQQVADRGIPIYQALANQFHTTAGAVFDMASQGKIGFHAFSQAMTTASGAVAQEMGKTIPGAFDNFHAALSRIGAGALSGIFPKIAPTIMAITQAMVPLEPLAAQLGATIGDRLNPAFESVTAFLNGANGGFTGLFQTLAPIAGVLAPLTGAFLALGTGALPAVLGKIPILGDMLGMLIGALAGLIAVSPQLQQAFGVIGSQLAQTFGNLLTTLGPVIGQIGSALAVMAQTIGGVLADALLTVAPFLSQLVKILGGVLLAVLPSMLTLIHPAVGHLLGPRWGARPGSGRGVAGSRACVLVDRSDHRHHCLGDRASGVDARDSAHADLPSARTDGDDVVVCDHTADPDRAAASELSGVRAGADSHGSYPGAVANHPHDREPRREARWHAGPDPASPRPADRSADHRVHAVGWGAFAAVDGPVLRAHADHPGALHCVPSAPQTDLGLRDGFSSRFW